MFLPGESQGQGSLVGCYLWGHTESDTAEATQQQQQQRNEKESRPLVSDSVQPQGLTIQSSPWASPGKNTGVGRLSILQRLFPTQGLNPGLPRYRRILYQLSHKGST